MTTIGPVNKPDNIQSVRNDRLDSLANKLEANFLAEMFKASGVGKPRETFGGGAAEDQFSTFLVQEYAEATVAAGGIGLSEFIYQSLVQKEKSS